jgi:hypothetical protein
MIHSFKGVNKIGSWAVVIFSLPWWHLLPINTEVRLGLIYVEEMRTYPNSLQVGFNLGLLGANWIARLFVGIPISTKE